MARQTVISHPRSNRRRQFCPVPEHPVWRQRMAGRPDPGLSVQQEIVLIGSCSG
jgi:hypothetical protein